MVDTVDTRAIANGPRYSIVRMTNISDGTGETLVHKVILANLKLTDQTPPTRLSVKEIQWTIQGFSSVRLYWDRAPIAIIDLLAAGNGYMEYGALGMLSDIGTGGTGDIMLTTNGLVANATYDITLVCLLS